MGTSRTRWTRGERRMLGEARPRTPARAEVARHAASSIEPSRIARRMDASKQGVGEWVIADLRVRPPKPRSPLPSFLRPNRPEAGVFRNDAAASDRCLAFGSDM